jgi:hypothetical protein
MTRTLVRALSVLTLAAIATSCVDLKEVPITGVQSSFYNTPPGFEQAVNAMYEPLRSFYGRERGFTMTVFGTDEYTKGADGSHKFWNDYDASLNGDASFARDTWQDFYLAINTTNTVIARSKDVPITDALRSARVAEARFLRALYYFNLVRMFGDVPIVVEEALAPKTDAARDPAAKVYDQIIADLTFAEANLPAVQKDYGRATKPAAQHLLAQAYLTRGQPGDFALAAAKGQAVINSNQFRLLPRFADLFAFGNEKNDEVIWSVQYTADPLTTGPGNNGHLYFLMAYELWPGMVRDVQNGRAFKRFRPTTWLLALWGDVRTTKDTRYDDSFRNVWYANNAATIPKNASGAPKFTLGDTAIWMPGYQLTPADSASRRYQVFSPRNYTNAVFPSLKKFEDPNRLSVNDERGSRDFVIMRLADTYLLVAEALVRDGRAAEAVQYVNAVRERAAKTPADKPAMDITVAALTGDPAGIDYILDERSRELAGEGMRWFDLARTGRLVARVKLRNSNAAGNIKDCHVLRPIPTAQIERSTIPFPQNSCY